MSNIFLSYNRHSVAVVKDLVDDIKALGHTVWFDQELRGGQTWWDQILATVRNCDVLVFVLDPEALNSTACKREYGYAADLGKPILPVLVAEGISTNLLPPALSQIQFVDYRTQDRAAAFRLAKALATVPPSKPLPDPLPVPPEVPISYLGRLGEQIDTLSILDYDKQSVLVVDLKRSLRDLETADDARALLERLRKRRDLLATIAEEIDELLGGIRKAPSTPSRASKLELPPQEPLSKTPRSLQKKEPLEPERMKGALTGALLGTLVGVTLGSTVTNPPWTIAVITGVGGAIAGAISGTHRQGILGALLGAALGWLLVGILCRLSGTAPAVGVGGVFGAPAGAVVGAIIADRKRRKVVTNHPL